MNIGIRIQACLRSAQSSGSDVGRRCNVSHAQVSRVIHGLSRNAHVEQTVSLITGLTLHELWPDWYGADNSPIKRKRLTHAERRARSQALLTQLAAARRQAA